MNEPFIFRFTPLKEDYIRSYRSFSLRLNSTRRVLIMLGLFFLSDLFYLFFTHFQFNFLAIVTIIVVLMLIFTILIPIRLYNQVRNNERLLAEVTWNVNDLGVVVSTKYVESKLDWGSYSEYIETADYFFIIYSINKNCYQFVPKKAFSSTEQEQEFRNILGRYLQKAPLKSRRSWGSISFSLSLFIYAILFVAIVITVIFSFLGKMK